MKDINSHFMETSNWNELMFVQCWFVVTMHLIISKRLPRIWIQVQASDLTDPLISYGPKKHGKWDFVQEKAWGNFIIVVRWTANTKPVTIYDMSRTYYSQYSSNVSFWICQFGIVLTFYAWGKNSEVFYSLVFRPDETYRMYISR